MNSDIQHRLVQLFKQWAGSEPATVIPIAGSGSPRKYFRLNNGSQTAIGVYHTDEAENSAFIEFSKHFRKHKLPVPEIYAVNLDHYVYLLQDLGDTSLFSLVEKANNSGGLTEKVIDLYKRSLEQLVRFQVIAGKDLDYSFCYPRASFDKQSIFWDLNHFKYYFLKLTGINFDEQKLEDDFHTLTDYLLQADGQFFMFRDFQSRNIMILNNSPYFIDYQGGRRGALQYDLASLLFQAKAKLPFDVRDQLLNYYLDKLEDYIPVDHKEFIRFYHGYILIRVIQVLGTYGYRGLYENKSHFIQSIPYALQNLEWLLANISLPVDLPELWRSLQQILRNEDQFTHSDDRQGLQVLVNSFSFKKGIPKDKSGHGGGFVFDCRALPNPGREAKYRFLSGVDQPVIEFLNAQPEVETFLKSIYTIVDQSVETYLNRGFSNLMVSFGCTGGQHRSVFCAEKLMQHLIDKFSIHGSLKHREEVNWVRR